ncbi:helix-turn-helix domain-containing protein [Roseovarius sp. ZX-A-9]|uniref:helix-turn-helix domain-containing protein n=1 Tax=Roseovarius sp. ZX-A-9 TaxID=3014783 RepID=UPI00232C25D1|nr:helix-turn-helix domain-containing protein [Roseovarius sp. ZX-A-9]
MIALNQRNRDFETANHKAPNYSLLTIAEVAEHFRLRPATIRTWVRVGRIDANRIGRDFRLTWADVWACENAPRPRGAAQEARYRQSLITKADISAGMKVSVRTVDRWILSGLPTRNVGANVRMNPQDAQEWLKAEFRLLAPLFPYLTDEQLS